MKTKEPQNPIMIVGQGAKEQLTSIIQDYDLVSGLNRRAIPSKPAEGRFNGETEQSNVVILSGDNTVEAALFVYDWVLKTGQDYILVADKWRDAYLFNVNTGEVVELGKLVSSKHVPGDRDYTKVNGVYYYTDMSK